MCKIAKDLWFSYLGGVQIESKINTNFKKCSPIMIHVKSWQQTQLLLCNYRDAAHRLHPLAGQGVNLGFGDVSCLSQVLNEAAQSGSDVGSLYYLSKYETERQRAVLPVVMTIHGLHHLYNTDFSPVVLLRSLGLQSTNALQFVKVGSTFVILFFLYVNTFILSFWICWSLITNILMTAFLLLTSWN